MNKKIKQFDKNLSLNRRALIKGLGLIPLLPFLPACQHAAKTPQWTETDYLSLISPINRTLNDYAQPLFSGDDFSRPHQVLWDKSSYIKVIGGLPKPKRKEDLVIIGGGMSGLMSAYLLRDKKPVILEQARRFGGNAKGEAWNGLNYVASWIFQDEMVFNFCLIFIASILAFLLFNLRIFGRSSAKIFLGDTGSTLFGFTVCWLLIDASQGEKNLITPTTALWIIALPLFDSVCIMLRRISKGRSPFAPDREHLHHVFHLAGYSINQTLSIILTFSFGLSFTGITASLFLKVPEPILFGFFILLFASHYWLMNHAWTVIKICRYLSHTKVSERRVENQRVEVDRRSGTNRRYMPTQREIEKIDSSNAFLRAILLKQRFGGESNKQRTPKPRWGKRIKIFNKIKP
jgi:Glycosyl transferase family 4/NAD(P)-binding Rossmann-like domain